MLALSADHGMSDVPVTRGASRVASEDVRERIEDLLITQFGPAPNNTRYVVPTSLAKGPGVDPPEKRIQSAKDRRMIRVF